MVLAPYKAALHVLVEWAEIRYSSLLHCGSISWFYGRLKQTSRQPWIIILLIRCASFALHITKWEKQMRLSNVPCSQSGRFDSFQRTITSVSVGWEVGCKLRVTWFNRFELISINYTFTKRGTCAFYIIQNRIYGSLDNSVIIVAETVSVSEQYCTWRSFVLLCWPAVY